MREEEFRYKNLLKIHAIREAPKKFYWRDSHGRFAAAPWGYAFLFALAVSLMVFLWVL